MTLVAISYNPPTNSSKWKKGLALLASKLQHHKDKSPTTRAAATEKVLRHNSNTVIKCEDLTAKEFAQMAGIKLKEEDVLEEDVYLTTKSTTTLNNHQMTSISTTLSTKSCHQIWDSDFWQSNEPVKKKKVTPKKSTLGVHTKRNNNNNNNNNINNDTLFISQLRSSSSTINSVQKGRFKIVVGQDDCEPVNQYNHVVLEWKRKRSDSSTTNITKK
ncbi:hypothetical protein INT47_011019 [Mucor saturninus]|uniref:Uncharacterized protein n=1 Tax=Mucor saturninus TaxID=64648 RepID=A0A8H7RDC1_9FUNG|nr:hypothetical protein INT47_011019 [Mucor saturninus]